jgi:tetratricopeptide (TPR) repeat protein
VRIKVALVVLTLMSTPAFAEESQFNTEEMLVKSATHHTEMKDYSAAAQDVEEIYALTKDEIRYKNGLAVIAYKRGDKEQAYKLCKEAMEIKPNTKSSKCIANYYYDNNNPAMMRYYAEKTLEIDPNDDEARNVIFKMDEYDRKQAELQLQQQYAQQQAAYNRVLRRQAFGQALQSFGNQMQQNSRQQTPIRTHCSSYGSYDYRTTNCNTTGY